MKTVPTLCATATVVGVSSAGLAVGRPEPAPPATPSAKRRIPTHFDRTRDGVVPPRPYTSTSVPQAQPFGSHPPNGAFVSGSNNEGAALFNELPRRMTIENSSPQLPPATDNGRVPAVEESAGFEGSGSGLRARPSWVKRLSIVSLSQSSTRTSNASPIPPSPAFSFATGSLAFSHDGSTAPMVGNTTAAPLPPNKLVKRSSSVRIPNGSEQQSIRSKRPTLRRPATSHQRSATLQQNPGYFDLPVRRTDGQGMTPCSQADPDASWRQFFTPTVKNNGKKRGLSGDAKMITRIIPSDKHHPTLILANAVTAPAVEVEDSSSQAGDGDSDYALSRPETPAEFNAVPQRPTSLAFSDSPAYAPSPTDGTTEEGRARHSFSISDILGSVPQSRKSRDRRSFPGSRLIRRDSENIANGNGPLMMADGESDASPREIYSSHSNHTGSNADISLGDSSRPLSSPVPDSRTVSLDISNFAPSRLPSQSTSQAESRVPSQQGYTPPQRPLSHRPASPSGAPIRPSRYSMTPSEQTSTLVGSDTEARGLGSGDDEDFDFQSDTVFDSLRTRGTRASSGARGPRIETIFDESPPQLKKKLSSLRDLLPKGTFPEPEKHAITEEEENLSTPVRTVKADGSNNGSPTPGAVSNARFSADIPSSPPKPLSLGTLEWDNMADEDEDDGRWSFDDESSDWDVGYERTPSMHLATPLSMKRSNPVLLGSSPVSTATAQHLAAENPDKDARSSIFDWSEPAADMSSGNRTPPRPATVHGKKDANGRGSRSVVRRAPSGLHARSQSVPIVPVISSKRNQVVTNKFGTWGVGSKGVTEDWDDDFDFSECPDEEDSPDGLASPTMLVPSSIREQQTNVLANIGLLREWGLLIEELKDLRSRAVSLNLLGGPFASMWQEVDAMIDLADQEADEPPMIPRLSPPSTPGFDADAFDEFFASTPASGRQRGRSILQTRQENLGNGASPALSTGTRGRRKSLFGAHEDIFSSPSPAPQGTPQSIPVGRPRKNSEAVARSVIEALQKRKSTSDPFSPRPTTPTKKVPFDTATLKHIVPYVNGLTRKVKDAVRETERLYSSPTQSPEADEPSFGVFLPDHNDGSPSSRRSRRSRLDLSTENLPSKENDLVTQMKLMTVM